MVVAAAPQQAPDAPLTRNEGYARLRIAMLERKRGGPLRRDDTIDDSVALDIQTRVDI